MTRVSGLLLSLPLCFELQFKTKVKTQSRSRLRLGLAPAVELRLSCASRKPWREQKVPGSVPGQGTQRGWRGWWEVREMCCNPSAALSAGAGPRGTAAQSERCSGTRATDSSIIKKNLFHLWV